MKSVETNAARYNGPRLFGAPVGDFSFLQTILFTLALGVGGVMIGTFCGIVVLMFALIAGHKNVDFSLSYKYGGLPLGILLLVTSAIYLGSLLARRLTRRG